MLKKYLPELKNLLRKQNPLNPQYPSNSPVSQQTDPAEDSSTSPNLLYPLKKNFVKTEVFQKSLAKTFFLLSLVPLIIAVVLFAVNEVSKIQLKEVTAQRDSLTQELQNRDFKDREAIAVIKKIELLKESQPEDQLFNSHTSALVEDLPASVDLVGINTSPSETLVSTKSTSALSVAQLILHYLEGGNVKEVTITSAELRTSEGVYVVDLELGY